MDAEANAVPNLTLLFGRLEQETAALDAWRGDDWVDLLVRTQRRAETLATLGAALEASAPGPAELERLQAIHTVGARAMHRIRVLRAAAAAESSGLVDRHQLFEELSKQSSY